MAKEVKAQWINFKISKSEKEILRKAAELDDRSVSAFVRRAALMSARVLIEEHEGSQA